MDQQRLDAIRARCEAATKGPWELTKDGRYEDHDECRINLPNDTIELCSYENGEFIAHARTDVPDLLAEVERLTRELEAAKRDIEIALGTQRVCFACKNVIPCSNSITGEYGCDPKWRGLREGKPDATKEASHASD